MNEELKSLAFALQKYPERVELMPLDQLLQDSARQNGKRPAYVKLSVPDDIVKTLRGRPEQRDLVLLVRVAKDVLEREDSLLVLPGDVR